MRIEPAEMGDLDWITEQWVALADEQRQYGSHLAATSNREPMRMTIAAYIADDGLLVARDDGVVGFVMFGLDEGSLEEDVVRGVVHNVYVVPDARNGGVGSALLDAAEGALIDAGATVIGLEAMAENDDARRFYRDRGYRPHRITYERPAKSDTLSSEDR